MKTLYRLIYFLTSLSLTSCVVSVPCEDAKMSICFISFTNEETDSIIIKWYQKDTDYKILIDSLRIDSSNSVCSRSGDSLTFDYSIGYYQGIKSGYDYKIFLPRLQTVYKISNIEEIYEKRKVGFSSNPPSCFNPITSYRLNGQKIEAEENYSSIFIHK